MRFLSFILCAVISMDLYGININDALNAFSGMKIDKIFGDSVGILLKDKLKFEEDDIYSDRIEEEKNNKAAPENVKFSSGFLSRGYIFPQQKGPIAIMPFSDWKNVVWVDAYGVIHIPGGPDKFDISLNGYHVLHTPVLDDNKLMFTCLQDNDNRVRLIVYDINEEEEIDITPAGSFEDLEIICGVKHHLIIRIKANNVYTLYKIDINNGQMYRMMSSANLILPICDPKTLDILLMYEINGHKADVFLMENGEKFLIDTVDINKSRYVSAVKDSNGTIVCRKIEETEKGIRIIARSSKSGNISDAYADNSKGKKISDINTCIDANGVLLAISYIAENGKVAYRGCESGVKDILSSIAALFPTDYWSIKAISSNRAKFLIQVQNSDKPTQWVIYNRNTGKYQTVFSCSKGLKETAFQKTKLIEIPSTNTKAAPIRVTYTAGRNNASNNSSSNSRTVLIMITGNNTTLSERKYNPYVQLFANRGMDVIGISPRAGQITNDIKKAIDWYKSSHKTTKNKFDSNQYSIIIYGDNESALKSFGSIPETSMVILDLCEIKSDRKISQIMDHTTADSRQQLILIGQNNENQNRMYSNSRFSNIKFNTNTEVAMLEQNDERLKAAIIENFLHKILDIVHESPSKDESNSFKMIKESGKSENSNFDTQGNRMSTINRSMQSVYNNEIYEVY